MGGAGPASPLFLSTIPPTTPHPTYHPIPISLTHRPNRPLGLAWLGRECEAYALKMAKLDFNEEGEKELVEQVFSNAVDALSEEVGGGSLVGSCLVGWMSVSVNK